MIDPVTSEILERIRRIETRTTVLGIHLGADIGGGRHEWDNGGVYAPTRNCSIGELVKVIPQDWCKDVPVYVKDDYFFTIARD